MRNKWYKAGLGITLAVVIGGGLIWVLNIEAVIQGPWSTIFGVVATASGIILALLQWYTSLAQGYPTEMVTPPQKVFKLGVGKQKGAIIIYTRRKMRGMTIVLSQGFGTVATHPDFATNVIERNIQGRSIFVGTFPALAPGNYKNACAIYWALWAD